MNKKHPHTHKAFTLIEVIIYILLFGIIIVGLVDTSIRLSQQSQDAVLREQLVLESSLSFSTLNQAISLGDTLNESLSTLDSDNSHLVFTDVDGNLQEFFLNEGVLQQQTNSGPILDLHSGDISVNSFNVSRINPSSEVIILKVGVEFQDDLSHSYALNTSLNFRHD
jgi:type II secretory pathway pseudopilin PulG